MPATFWQYGHAKSNALTIVTGALAGPSTWPALTAPWQEAEWAMRLTS